MGGARLALGRLSRACHSIHSLRRLSERDVIKELDSRGLVQTLTSRSIKPHLSSASRTVYSGVDPSASSLHVGNLLPLLTLAHFARFGHKPIVLVGGATGSIGDPSGRSTERNALDQHTLTTNVEAITRQLRTFFANVAQFYDATSAEANGDAGDAGEAVELGLGVTLMNNLAWTKSVTLLEFLSTVGRHARLSQMLARDSVASRLSSSASSASASGAGAGAGGAMSYTEFSYQLLQAFDFAHLHSTAACTVQVGGSDQLGNIAAGIDLIRRTTVGGFKAMQEHDDAAFGLTLPLLTTASGEKFGKSAGNAVWLDSAKTSDLEFYQFFLRSADADVERYLKALTLMEVAEVDSVMEAHTMEPKRRLAQRRLADHITALIRGRQTADKCKGLTELLFSHTATHASPEEAAKSALAQLDLATISEQDNVLTRLNRDQVVAQDLTRLVVAAGLVKSRGEAKRLLSSGGLYVNNRQMKEGADAVVQDADLVQSKHGGAVCLLRAGKSAVRVVHIST